MCGRFLLQAPVADLRRAFGFEERPNLQPRYNIAPTQAVPIVRRSHQDGGGRELALARWGLIPAWAKDAGIGGRLINARAETVAEKPAFRGAFRKRRALVPTYGFYEWRKREGGRLKQPMLIRRRDGEPFALAGLWEHWRGPEKECCSSEEATDHWDQLEARGIKVELFDGMVANGAGLTGWLRHSIRSAATGQQRGGRTGP